MAQRRIHLVVNPASGQWRTPLETLTNVLRRADVCWDVSIAKHADDASRSAREAAQAGADVVAAYGGDGTAASVASGLLGTGKRLALLGGGTANVLTTELGLPDTPAEACALACGQDSATGVLDVIAIKEDGQDDARHVLLQAGLGLHARVIEDMQRRRKKTLGRLAYVLSILRQIVRPETIRFHLTIDGVSLEREGVACLICNSGRLGSGMLQWAPSINARDGWLDVLLFERADVATALRVFHSALSGRPPEARHVEHWQARRVHVETPTTQPVQGDGNIIAQTPLTARLLPGALPVVVPEEAQIVKLASAA